MAVRVALVQVDVADDEKPAARVERVADVVRQQRDEADLVVLPELWHVGAFALELAKAYAEPMDGAFVAAMRDAARESGLWLHAGSFAELDPATGNRYNTSLVLRPDGSTAAAYRKRHLFGWEDGEPSVMSSGDDLVVVETPLGPTGLATCYDLRFPELYRGLVDAGAVSFLMASGWPAVRVEHWSVLLRARAIEDQAWVVACNTAGTHNGVPMGGRSAVIDPLGVVVAEAGEGEQVLRAVVDPDAATSWRTKFPVLADRLL
jgi:predicted amidohydrolase